MVDYHNIERFLQSRIKRRNLIIGAGALSGFAIANQFSHQTAMGKSRFSNYPFTLGVAAEPTAWTNGMVTWLPAIASLDGFPRTTPSLESSLPSRRCAFPLGDEFAG